MWKNVRQCGAAMKQGPVQRAEILSGGAFPQFAAVFGEIFTKAYSLFICSKPLIFFPTNSIFLK
jgi:hypothetical protein